MKSLAIGSVSISLNARSRRGSAISTQSEARRSSRAGARGTWFRAEVPAGAVEGVAAAHVGGHGHGIARAGVGVGRVPPHRLACSLSWSGLMAATFAGTD